MATKDHSLDQRIIDAARAEFMEHGFRNALLQKIASRAGITTGALYTRYKNKDDLFCSLIRSLLTEISTNSASVEVLYREAHEARSTEAFLKAIQAEEQVYMDLLFQHYEECVLLFCKSDGSSLEVMIHHMMEEKTKQTVEYFKSISHKTFDFHGLEIIMSQFYYYCRQILLRGYTKEEAVSCMKTIDLFLEAGWKAIFDRIL